MSVTILWDSPRRLLLSLLHLVSREKEELKTDQSTNYFDASHAVFKCAFSILTLLPYVTVFSPDEAEAKLPELHLGLDQHRCGLTLGMVIFSHSSK